VQTSGSKGRSPSTSRLESVISDDRRGGRESGEQIARGVAGWIGWVVMAIGGLVLAAWWLHIDLGIPTASMKANTALALAMAGVAVRRYSRSGGTRWSRRAALVCSALVLAIGAATSLEWLLDVDLGIDTLLVHDEHPTGVAGVAGRMAPTAAGCLVLLGAALLLMRRDTRRSARITHVLALIVGLVSLVAIIGYVYDVGPTFGLARYTTQMAIHTALAFLLLSAAIQLSRPGHFLVGLATSDRAAGVLMRRLLPASVLLPVAVGWLRLVGQRAGFYDTELGLALYCTANLTIFATLVAWIAGAVEHQDQARRAIDRKLQQAHHELETRVQERTAELSELNRQLHQEVAERERAQKAEQASTELIKATIESASYAVITTALDGTIVGFNSTAERLLGWRADELIGRHTPAIIHDDREMAERAAALSGELGVLIRPGPEVLHARLARGLVEEAEWTYVRKDGSRFPVLASMSVLRDAAGEPHGYVGIARDQTEQHRIDAEVRELRRALEFAVEGVARLDQDGRFVSANAAYAAALGCTCDELVGMAWPQTIESDHIDEMKDAYARMRANGKVEIETVGVRRDGATFDQWIVLVPIRDQRGEFTGHYCFSKDISQQKQAERDLHAAKRAAEAAMRARSQFLARMSHEIRTPMNGALGMVELALHTDLSAQQREYLHTAHASANDLLRLIDDILDFAKIDAGHLRLERNPFRLRSCLGATMKSLAHRAQTKRLALQIDVPPDVPERLLGDPQRLGQVLINLVGNAIKFTERGHIRLTVSRTGMLRGAPLLRFSVTDTGIGIPAEEQQHIFDEFTQADERVSSRYGGTGLGLTISRQLVQLMDGDIGVFSEPGRGSTFWFTARIEAASEMEDGEEDPLADLRGRGVLVIDDDTERRRMAADLLEAWGLRATGIAPGERDTDGREGRAFALVHDDVLERHPETSLSAIGDDTPVIVVGAAPVGLACLENRSGAVVPLLWPITASALHDAAATAMDVAIPSGARERRASLSGMGRGLRVLLAEDHPVNRKLAISVLEKAGHQVVAVEEGRSAVEAVARGGIDVVLMDVQMPIMDGLTAARLIRASEEADGEHIPIIALTAQAMRDERERGIAAGMDGYIVKPFQARTLIAEIETVVAHTIARRRVSDTVPDPVPAEPAPQADPVFDHAGALDRISGDKQLLGELLAIFLEDVPIKRGSIKNALASGDDQLLARSAHNLRGALLTLAARPAAQAARELEDAARKGGPRSAAAMALEFELELLVNELSRVVAQP
jgi:PAS domain S-box-containing protein